MTMETIALLMAPIGGLVLGAVVYIVATREARRERKREAAKPAVDARP
jgi:hypothetical protein